MEQLNTSDQDPPISTSFEKSEQGDLKVKRHCPFIGLDHDPETVMAFPFHLNHCHRIQPSQKIRLDYQATHCLTFAHRHCPVLLDRSIKTLPPEIAIRTKKQRTMIFMFSSVSIILVLAVVFWLFGGQWATSAGDLFGNLGGEQTQQDKMVLQGRPTQTIDKEDLSLFFPLIKNPISAAESMNTQIPPTQISAPQSTPTPTIQSCNPPASWVIYIVRPGDTLFSISQATNVTVAELQESNCLDTSSVVEPGDELYVPFIPTASSTPTSLPIPPSTLVPTQRPSNTPTATSQPTDTPRPTYTATSQPTDTPIPTYTATSQPTDTPRPTYTSTSQPSNTPIPPTPTSAPPDTPTSAPLDTPTSAPLDTPTSAPTLAPTNTPVPIIPPTDVPATPDN